MSASEFDANAILSALRRDAHLHVRRRYHRSRLDRHRAELVMLHKAEASFAELRRWLSSCKRLKVSRTTIFRYLRKLPEVQNG